MTHEELAAFDALGAPHQRLAIEASPQNEITPYEEEEDLPLVSYRGPSTTLRERERSPARRRLPEQSGIGNSPAASAHTQNEDTEMEEDEEGREVAFQDGRRQPRAGSASRTGRPAPINERAKKAIERLEGKDLSHITRANLYETVNSLEDFTKLKKNSPEQVYQKLLVRKLLDREGYVKQGAWLHHKKAIKELERLMEQNELQHRPVATVDTQVVNAAQAHRVREADRAEQERATRRGNYTEPTPSPSATPSRETTPGPRETYTREQLTTLFNELPLPTDDGSRAQKARGGEWWDEAVLHRREFEYF